MLVDVVVTDKRGKPVTDLKASDFTLQEKGRNQKIAIQSSGFKGQGPHGDLHPYQRPHRAAGLPDPQPFYNALVQYLPREQEGKAAAAPPVADADNVRANSTTLADAFNQRIQAFQNAQVAYQEDRRIEITLGAMRTAWHEFLRRSRTQECAMGYCWFSSSA